MEDVKRINRELRCKGKILDFYKDTMLLPNGKTTEWDFLHHHGAAAVVPVDDEGNIFVVKQYRPGIDGVSIEIPAGCLNDGEDRRTAAIRELEEEIGYTCGKAELLLKFHSAFAYCDEYIEIYLCTQLKKSAQKLDEDEYLEVERIPADALKNMIFEGKITDSKTIAGILAYFTKNS